MKGRINASICSRMETEVVLDLTKTLTQQIMSATNLNADEQAAVDIESALSEHLNPSKPEQPVQGRLKHCDDIVALNIEI